LYKLSKIIFSDDFRLLEEVAGRPGNEQLFETVADFNRQWLDTFRMAYDEYMDRLLRIFDASGITTDDLDGKSMHVLWKLEAYRKSLDNLGDVHDRLGKLLGNPAAYQTDSKRSAVVNVLYEQLDPEVRSEERR